MKTITSKATSSHTKNYTEIGEKKEQDIKKHNKPKVKILKS